MVDISQVLAFSSGSSAQSAKQDHPFQFRSCLHHRAATLCPETGHYLRIVFFALFLPLFPSWGLCSIVSKQLYWVSHPWNEGDLYFVFCFLGRIKCFVYLFLFRKEWKKSRIQWWMQKISLHPRKEMKWRRKSNICLFTLWGARQWWVLHRNPHKTRSHCPVDILFRVALCVTVKRYIRPLHFSSFLFSSFGTFHRFFDFKK